MSWTLDNKVKKMDIKTGTNITKDYIVTADMTAKAIKSGAAEVLSTPHMIALMEDVSCDAVAQFLPSGYISVGTTVDIKHLRPTPVGRKIAVSGTITKVDGNKIMLKVECYDSHGQIGTGEHGRCIVCHDTFMASCNK